MRLEVSSLDSTPTTQDVDFPWRTKLSQGRSSVPAHQMLAGETEGRRPKRKERIVEFLQLCLRMLFLPIGS